MNTGKIRLVIYFWSPRGFRHFSVIIMLFYKNIEKYNMLMNINILYDETYFINVFFFYYVSEYISVMKIFPYCTNVGNIMFIFCIVWKFSPPPSDAKYETFSARSLRSRFFVRFVEQSVGKKWFGYVGEMVIDNCCKGQKQSFVICCLH